MPIAILAAALAGVLTSSAPLAAAPADTVDYRLSPAFGAAGLSALDVTIRLRAGPDGVTPISLPDHYASGKEFWRNLRDFRVDGATAVETTDPAHRIVHSLPSAPLTIRYRVVPHDNQDPTTEDYDQPAIRPTWFQALGTTIFAAPDGRDAEPARFDWVGGRGFKFASDLEHLAGEARAATRPGTVRDVTESTVIGSPDLIVAGSGAVRFAQIGAFRFSAHDGAELGAKILSTERALWGDPPGPYLLTLAPVYAPSGLDEMFVGDGLGDGFALRMTPNTPFAHLRFLFAHETFHTWNPHQLGATQHGADQGFSFWFSEGVSDFYARRSLVRGGVVSPQAFADMWNVMLVAYAASPVRDAPNTRVKADFWNDPNVYNLPHQRGAMLAALWDARIRAQTGGRTSLDTILRAQREAARRDPSVLAVQLFPEVAMRHGLDVRSDIARFIDRGEPVVLPADAFAPCARVEWRQQPTYELGWAAETTRKADYVVTGLREGSPAYRAGLRNGMKLIERLEGGEEDSAVATALRVRAADGSEHVIRFKPEGKSRLKVQRIVLTPLAHQARCRGALGGF